MSYVEAGDVCKYLGAADCRNLEGACVWHKSDKVKSHCQSYRKEIKIPVVSSVSAEDVGTYTISDSALFTDMDDTTTLVLQTAPKSILASKATIIGYTADPSKPILGGQYRVINGPGGAIQIIINAGIDAATKQETYPIAVIQYGVDEPKKFSAHIIKHFTKANAKAGLNAYIQSTNYNVKIGIPSIAASGINVSSINKFSGDIPQFVIGRNDADKVYVISKEFTDALTNATTTLDADALRKESSQLVEALNKEVDKNWPFELEGKFMDNDPSTGIKISMVMPIKDAPVKK